MSAKAVIHINGKDYDAGSGEALTNKGKEKTPAKHEAHKPVHSAKPAHVHHVPRKSTTLARSTVSKPKIISDIRNTPTENVARKIMPENQPTRSHLSPKVMHFAKIEPRMIDTSQTDTPPQALPDGPPPLAHHRIHSKKEMHIKRQLASATAHKAKPLKKLRHHKPVHRRASTVLAGFAAFGLLAGFAIYQNIPGLSVNLASRRAGFSAALPKFTPGGFKISGPVEYGQGRVVLSFRSNTDDRSYKIEQNPTMLTDSELKALVAKESSGKFQAFDEGGQTIYITGDTAIWAKGGVKYSLEGDSGLSSTQIASIATSL